jgi:hypothetical protein
MQSHEQTCCEGFDGEDRKQIGDDIWIGAGYIELIRLGVFKFLFDQLEALSPQLNAVGVNLSGTFFLLTLLI